LFKINDDVMLYDLKGHLDQLNDLRTYEEMKNMVASTQLNMFDPHFWSIVFSYKYNSHYTN